MNSVNKVILVGRVGQDPTTKMVNESSMVANFSLATSEKYKNKAGEKVETTEWHNIVAWRFLAEFCEQRVIKGQLLYLEGKLTTRSWDNKDGVIQYKTEVVIDTLTVLDWNNKQAVEDTEPSNEVPSDGEEATAEDDLPF